MSNEILNKIKFLCRAIPKVEWSGILLYSVKGTIKNPEKMSIILQDIIPMNKGTQAYTEYSFNEKKRDTSEYDDKHIEYVMSNTKAMDWKIGHIHSHNSMGVFFSGTDMDELRENSASHNFYFSLIVNNWMDFCAKVAFRVTAQTQVLTPYTALDENGNSYNIEDVTLNVKKEKMFIHDCVIESPKEKLNISKYFADSVADIIQKAEAKTKVVSIVPTQKPVFTPANSVKPITNPTTPAHTTMKQATQKPSTKIKDIINGMPWQELPDWDFSEDDDFDTLTPVEEFVVSLLRGSNPPDNTVTNIDEALEELVSLCEDVDDTSIAQNIVNNYPALYEKHFESEKDSDFVHVTELVIEILEEYEMIYPFLTTVRNALGYLLIKFEDNAITI